MASSLNDLERLSLDLPDVVVEAEKSGNSKTPKKGRGGRKCMKRNVNKQQPSQNSVTAAAAVAPPVEAIEAVEVERVPNPNMSLEAAVDKPPPKPEATPMPEGKLLVVHNTVPQM